MNKSGRILYENSNVTVTVNDDGKNCSIDENLIYRLDFLRDRIEDSILCVEKMKEPKVLINKLEEAIDDINEIVYCKIKKFDNEKNCSIDENLKSHPHYNSLNINENPKFKFVKKEDGTMNITFDSNEDFYNFYNSYFGLDV